VTDRRNRLGRDGAITAAFGDSSKMSEGERKASAAELLASVVEELRTGSLEAERVQELAQAAARLLGGLPPPPELVEGLVRCGLTEKEITEALGPLPEQATEAGAPADAASIKQLTYVPGLLGELIEWNVRTARYPSRVMALAAAIAVVGKLLDRKGRGRRCPELTSTPLCRADRVRKAASTGCRQSGANGSGPAQLDWAGRLLIGASAARGDQGEGIVHFGDGRVWVLPSTDQGCCPNGQHARDYWGDAKAVGQLDTV
jgi:hypothetical protein